MTANLKLYVGNFPFSWGEDDLENTFSDFKDNIVDIKIIYDHHSGRSRGFGFVAFDDERVAAEALKLADSEVGERRLVVSYARAPLQRREF